MFRREIRGTLSKKEQHFTNSEPNETQFKLNEKKKRYCGKEAVDLGPLRFGNDIYVEKKLEERENKVG